MHKFKSYIAINQLIDNSNPEIIIANSILSEIFQCEGWHFEENLKIILKSTKRLKGPILTVDPAFDMFDLASLTYGFAKSLIQLKPETPCYPNQALHNWLKYRISDKDRIIFHIGEMIVILTDYLMSNIARLGVNGNRNLFYIKNDILGKALDLNYIHEKQIATILYKNSTLVTFCFDKVILKMEVQSPGAQRPQVQPDNNES